MPARKRPASGATKSPQQRAIAIAIKNRMKYPYASYGRAYMERGTEDNLAMFGPTWKEATAEQRAKRRALGYTGRGAYWGKRIGSWIGRRTGIPGAGRLAGMAGSALEDYGRKRLGRGLYSGRGSYNTLIEGGDPAISATGTGDETESIVLTNREYVSDIYGPSSTGFVNEIFRLNPGNQDCFPWLSQLAANYEEYEFIQLVFEFRSTLDASTASNGQTGTIIMATDYNAAHQPFEDKETMMQYHGGHSGRTTSDMAHGVECDPGKSAGDMHKYVRTFGHEGAEDIKSYDHGIFQLALNNIPSTFQNQQVGELWVSYKVKLTKPKLGVARMVNQQRDVFIHDMAQTFSTSNPASTLIKCTNSNLNCSIVTVTSAPSVVFPAQYNGLVEIMMIFTGTAVATPPGLGTMVVAGNVDVVYDMYGGPTPNSPTADRPENHVKTYRIAGGVDGTYMFICHVRVKSATGGVDNVVHLPGVVSQMASVTQFCIDIREIVDMSNSTQTRGLAGLPE